MGNEQYASNFPKFPGINAHFEASNWVNYRISFWCHLLQSRLYLCLDSLEIGSELHTNNSKRGPEMLVSNLPTDHCKWAIPLERKHIAEQRLKADFSNSLDIYNLQHKINGFKCDYIDESSL